MLPFTALFALYNTDMGGDMLYIVTQLICSSTLIVVIGLVLGTAIWIPVKILCCDELLKDYKVFILAGVMISFVTLSLGRLHVEQQKQLDQQSVPGLVQSSPTDQNTVPHDQPHA